MLYCAWTAASWDDALIVAYDLENGEKKVLPARGITPGYVPLPGGGGALLWVRNSFL